MKRGAAWLAAAVFALWCALNAAGVALLVVTWDVPADAVGDSGPSTALGVLVSLVFAGVGLLLATRLPRNAIGWLFLAIAIATSLSFSLGRYGVYALEHPDSLPGATVALSLAQANWTFLIGSIALLLLLFPDGAPPSRRWRPMLVFALAGAAAAWVGFVTAPGPLQDPFSAYGNPLGVEALHAVDRILALGWLPMLAAMIAGAGSLVVRFRRSTGIERQQIKLFTLAAVTFPLMSIAANLFESTRYAGTVASMLAGLTALVLPVATAVAILRYRLYDFDRLVSRTIAYVALTAVLALTYVSLVLAGQALFSSFAGGSNLAIAASTLVVAALFLPLRGRIQRAVDRRFNRQRYDAQRTLEAFGARLREDIDLATLEESLRTVVTETMQPAHAAVWLNAGAQT